MDHEKPVIKKEYIFDTGVLKRIREALGDYHPRYLNKVYGDITLEDQLRDDDRLSKMEKDIEELKSNHLSHLGEDVYALGLELKKFRDEFNEFKKGL